MTHTEESLMSLAFRYGDARFDCGMSKEGKEREAAYGRMESTHYALLDAIREVLERAEKAEAEVERLKAGGCARNQGLTQYCAEAEALRKDAERYRHLRQIDRCIHWENLLMIRPITRTEDIDAAIDAAMRDQP